MNEILEVKSPLIEDWLIPKDVIRTARLIYYPNGDGTYLLIKNRQGRQGNVSLEALNEIKEFTMRNETK